MTIIYRGSDNDPNQVIGVSTLRQGVGHTGNELRNAINVLLDAEEKQDSSKKIYYNTEYTVFLKEDGMWTKHDRNMKFIPGERIGVLILHPTGTATCRYSFISGLIRTVCPNPNKATQLSFPLLPLELLPFAHLSVSTDDRTPP
eukprot:GHVU01010772.1.p1 GENE.GHVU01010772.1~~GHVU01010772.1.p1  ORF type:complete len:144 (+),score=11.13 GHVU01010772.1:247-678(+)